METKDNKSIRPNHFYETELWSLFTSKAEASGHSVEKLKDFCTDAETLSKRIIDSFPYYTLHDNTHTAGVCKWMYLLLGDKAKLISMEEAALLLMAACCHDLGMLIGENEETELIAQAKSNYGNWKEYIERHPNDREKLDSKKACHDVVINYVRENHHARVEKIMADNGFNKYFSDFNREFGIKKELLLAVCKSHGESLENMTALNTDEIDANLCSVLLRLADALDYDSNRAPEILYHFLGLDKAENRSSDEWKKNRGGFFKRSDASTLTYSAECDDPRIEADLNGYLDWLKAELPKCFNHIKTYCHKRINADNNPIPLLLERDFTRSGYDSAEIRLMMDQNRVLELLSGEELYGEQGVFVRELLQNSIDAVLMRCECDESFSFEQGKIDVDVWTDEQNGRYCWFRIKDNGIGMDKDIVQKYFLNVAHSYYNDEEGYIKDLLKQGKKVSSFKPISRFGIGILSCFMGEGKTNRMEISTKRYSFGKSEPSKPVRLDITGLNGYYYLTELSEVKKGEPMPQPPCESAEFEYIRDEGTTICLRLDLYNLSISSFRELLDKYIRFPKIKISFTDHRTADEKIYPTQQELEALLDKLNPDFDKTGEVAKHVHRMKADDFEKLKAAIPEADWSNVKCPELVLEYRPLHKMSLSGELSGAVIANASEPWQIKYNRVFTDSIGNPVSLFQPIGIGIDGSRYHLSADIAPSIPPYETDEIRAYLFEMANKIKSVCRNFSFELTEGEAGVQEVMLHGWLSDHSTRRLGTAYNGILCDFSELIGPFFPAGTLLLSGDLRPAVSVARDRIRDLPIDAACEIALMVGGIYSHLVPKGLRSYPASVFYAFLEKHKRLYAEVSEGLFGSADNLFPANTTLYYIQVADMKKRGIAFVINENGEFIIECDGGSGFDAEGAFPLTLFADRFDAKCLGIIYEFGRDLNSFSRFHPFSQWLIDNRGLLQKDAPTVYNRIIGAMVESRVPNELTLTLNTMLDQLGRLPNNPFNVPHNLRIKDGEIITYDY